MTQEQKYEKLRKIVEDTINAVGIVSFKKTSMFISSKCLNSEMKNAA
jgi:hypothetical protein